MHMNIALANITIRGCKIKLTDGTSNTMMSKTRLTGFWIALVTIHSNRGNGALNIGRIGGLFFGD